MPLTLDLWGPRNNGHFYIDRNQLIFQFVPDSKSTKDENEAALTRDIFSLIVDEFYRLNPEIKALVQPSPVSSSDARHVILDHMSKFDKKRYHRHLRFTNHIDYNLVEKILLGLPMLEQVIALDCRDDLLETSANYFDELLACKNLKKVEENYIEEKNSAFDDKTLKINAAISRQKAKMNFFQEYTPNPQHTLFICISSDLI